MGNYIIEGTISEVTKEIDKSTFKISGTDRYSVKRKDQKFNIFCNCTKGKKTKIVEDNKIPSLSLKIPNDYDFRISDKYLLFFLHALSSGHRVRIVFEELTKTKKSDDETEVLGKYLKILSLSLFTN